MEHLEEEAKETLAPGPEAHTAKTRVFLSQGTVSMWSPPSEPHRSLLAPAFPRDRALLDVWGADLFNGGLGGSGATAGP